MTTPEFGGPAGRRWWGVKLGNDTASWTMHVEVDEITGVRFFRERGQGELILWAASPARTVTGVEWDSGLLELTGELLAEPGLANVAFCQAELAGPGVHRPGGLLPLPAGSADLVIAGPPPPPAQNGLRCADSRDEIHGRVSAATAHRCAPVG